jgi:Protein of unknown function (DUF3237)
MDSRLLMTMQVALAVPQKIGTVPHGTRVTAPITGGNFEGARLRGRVLSGGGDWTLLRDSSSRTGSIRLPDVRLISPGDKKTKRGGGPSRTRELAGCHG